LQKKEKKTLVGWLLSSKDWGKAISVGTPWEQVVPEIISPQGCLPKRLRICSASPVFFCCVVYMGKGGVYLGDNTQKTLGRVPARFMQWCCSKGNKWSQTQTILFINNFIVQCKNYKGGARFRL
jgi:hypothetical protein